MQDQNTKSEQFYHEAHEEIQSQIPNSKT